MVVGNHRIVAKLQLSIAHYLGATSEQQVYGLTLQRMVDSWHMNRMRVQKRKLIWKCSHQRENGLRKPLHWEAELPQEAIRAHHSLGAQDLSTGTSYMEGILDTSQSRYYPVKSPKLLTSESLHLPCCCEDVYHVKLEAQLGSRCVNLCVWV